MASHPTPPLKKNISMFEAEVLKRSVFIVSPKLIYIYIDSLPRLWHVYLMEHDFSGTSSGTSDLLVSLLSWGTFFHSTQPAYLLKRGGAVSPSPEDSGRQIDDSFLDISKGPQWSYSCQKTLGYNSIDDVDVLNATRLWRESWISEGNISGQHLQDFTHLTWGYVHTIFSRITIFWSEIMQLAPCTWLKWMVSNVPSTSPRKSMFPKPGW